ncbi:Uncharacterised protein [Starkeya nomas]|uniref:Uncharacterized protein n=1 Tax=Starkeya nomas TaxID=2666134 RepID=A0A5S9NJL9_9HYPH|nr:Uncharacterised protein [Starkeya nomas]
MRCVIRRGRRPGTVPALPAFGYRCGAAVTGMNRKRESQMNRTLLTVAVVVLAGVAAFFAYRAYERDRNSLQIEVGPQGVKVDPPG